MWRRSLTISLIKIQNHLTKIDESAHIPQMLNWIPIGIGLGIMIPFAGIQSITAFLSGLIMLTLLCFKTQGRQFLGIGCLFLIMGFGVSHCFLNTLIFDTLQTPVHSAVIQGRIVKLARKNADKPHTQTIQMSVLSLKVPVQIPLPEFRTVRLKSHIANLSSEVGDLITVRANLTPIPDSIRYSGFDFKRYCFLEQIQALGTIKKVITSQKDHELSIIDHARLTIHRTFKQYLPFIVYPIASALVIGDRSDISSNLQSAFSDSGIAHILAISGLHMGIVTGFVFLIIRLFLCFIPWITLRYNTKKIAAPLALVVGILYLAISGFGIPAKRSLFMGGLVMVGVLINRRAVSMRSLSIAAIVILLWTPSAILSVSFYLSFAAVMGLIAWYERPRTWSTSPWRRTRIGRASASIWGCLVSTSVATLATTPLVIYFFGRINLHAFGLIYLQFHSPVFGLCQLDF